MEYHNQRRIFLYIQTLQLGSSIDAERPWSLWCKPRRQRPFFDRYLASLLSSFQRDIRITRHVSIASLRGAAVFAGGTH